MLQVSIRPDDSLGFDLKVRLDEREFDLMGRFASRFCENTINLLQNNPDSLPVVIGTGPRAFIELILDNTSGPVAFVDKEQAVISAFASHDVLNDERILLIQSSNAQDAISRLTAWQWENNGKIFLPIVIPSYLRIDRDYYKLIADTLKTGRQYDFWSRTRYPRFKNDKPRLLLITTNYFLMGEVMAACQRLDIPHHFLSLKNQEMGCEDFIQDILKAVIEFRPDFVFTINHLGIDREGVLMDLLSRMELPLASWFVDNPHLILYLYENLNSPYCTIFTWDSDNLKSLQDKGFDKVFYLPLATDCIRFAPGQSLSGFKSQTRDVSFVGNSMVHKVEARLEKVRRADDRGLLSKSYQQVAWEFVNSDHHLVYPLLEEKFFELREVFDALPSIESKLDFETLVTWEATRIYRNACVKQILDFNPFIAGDDGWLECFDHSQDWTYHPEFNYYDDLPGFYPYARINFNTTSAQMKGAVNQRVFDVPACGAFLITDYRKQMENLFDPGSEVVFYREEEEIKEIVTYYLKNPGKCDAISHKARNRILQQHTYDHRLLELCETMKKVYG